MDSNWLLSWLRLRVVSSQCMTGERVRGHGLYTCLDLSPSSLTWNVRAPSLVVVAENWNFRVQGSWGKIDDIVRVSTDQIEQN